MATMNPKIEKSWKQELFKEFQKPYFISLSKFIVSEVENNKIIYPPIDTIFSALDNTPFNQTKVVILGQDPYHGPNQAHGLCFSVSKKVTIPPSLKNIYKEIQNDLGYAIPQHGFLEQWTQQGVLLLNAVLTVRKSSPASHSGKGWEQFTDTIIQTLSDKKEGLVFLLWGRYAQEKGSKIDTTKHLVLKSPHPSPFSAHKGFFGCNHFSKTNTYLEKQGKKPIDWQIT